MVKGLGSLSIIFLLVKIISTKAGQQENYELNRNQIISTPLVKIKKCCPNGQTYDKWYNCVVIEGRKIKNISFRFIHCKIVVNPKQL